MRHPLRLLSPLQWVVAAAIVGLSIALAFNLAGLDATARGGDDAKRQLPPPVYATNEERKGAEIQATHDYHKDQDADREAFKATGQDIHTLEARSFSSMGFATDSLERAVAAAAGGIARGIVVEQSIEKGYVVSRLRVDAWLTDDKGETEVLLSQVGGPQKTSSGTYLVQRAEDPILRRGREYILFLRPCLDPRRAGSWCASGTGHQFEVYSSGAIKNPPGEVWDWMKEVEGLAVTTFEAMVAETHARLQ